MIKSIESLSAQELYEMAKRREKEEWEAQRAQRQSEVRALREERRSLIKSHEKSVRDLESILNAELARIDSQIGELTGVNPRAAAKQKKASGISATQHVLDIIGAAGELPTKAIGTALREKGVDTTNLAQTLAYLNRRGQIQRTGRGVYRKVGD